MTLEDVLEVYLQECSRRIVRLHSGDPSVYGAVQEQIDFCIGNQIDFEIIPGVTSLAAASAVLQRELTIPGLSQSIVFTRLAGKTSASMPDRESVSAYSRIGGTLGIFLSGARPKELQDELLCEGSAFDMSTPAAIIVKATWRDQKIIRTTVGSLAREMAGCGVNRTVLVLVGAVLSGPTTRSHLYSPDYSHRFRKRSLPGTTTGRPVNCQPLEAPRQ